MAKKDSAQAPTARKELAYVLRKVPFGYVVEEREVVLDGPPKWSADAGSAELAIRVLGARFMRRVTGLLRVV